MASSATPFSATYAVARQRFRQAARQLDWHLESYPIDASGPDGEELTIDVACSPGGTSDRVLVVSSGVHGIEGFPGSAIQIALLETWAITAAPATRCVFLHGLNPYGFAWLRRFDENNVDLNRNFLLPGERFEGAPEFYAELNNFLNPMLPPRRWEPFVLKALYLIALYGMSALQQSVASGQYCYPHGLFFGGIGPSKSQKILGENLSRWLAGSDRVVHLDFHTGLGPHGTCRLLIDYPLNERQHEWLTEWFGAGSFEACDSSTAAYDAKGGFGRWCAAQHLAPDYLFACAEFGTFGPVKVLGGLRAENQAHHWGEPKCNSTRRAKEQLRELFCPSSNAWRSQFLQRSFDLISRAQQGLLAVSGSVTLPHRVPGDTGGGLREA